MVYKVKEQYIGTVLVHNAIPKGVKLTADTSQQDIEKILALKTVTETNPAKDVTDFSYMFEEATPAVPVKPENK